MEFPFTVVFEPPTQQELRALLRMRRTWGLCAAIALAIGCVMLIAALGRADAVASSPPVPLQVTSHPSSASVWLDDREVGFTPLQLSVTTGAHALVLKTPDGLDGRYRLQAADPGATLHAMLWRRQPLVSRLRSTLPGATLSSAQLLADGQVGLEISLPAGHQLQAWRLEPGSGALEPLQTDVFGSRLRVSPDAQMVALLGYEIGPPLQRFDAYDAAPASVLWLIGAHPADSARGWRAPLGLTERLSDVSWSPLGNGLVVVASEQENARSTSAARIWRVDAGTLEARELLRLPSEVVPGSEVWSANGQHLAFVAHAPGVNALCQLDLDGAFRYVADLDAGFERPLGHPVAAWSSDSQRLLFVAPRQRPPGAPTTWLQPPEPTHVLYSASPAEPTPAAVGNTTVDLAAWREDSQILGLGRLGADGALDIRLMDGSPAGQHLLDLQLRPAGAYAATWDLERARVLIAAYGASGLVEYWLARLGWDGVP